jgi:hypothetical protein
MTRLLLVCVMVAFAHPLRADDIDPKAVARAHDYLKTAKRGEFVNGFAHFGTQYLGHKYIKTLNVNDGKGNKMLGHFALVYEYNWTDGGNTQLAFLCDAGGQLYKLQVMKSNGVFQQPFAVANLSIKVIGEALYEGLKDKITDGDRRLLRKLVDDADAQGLLLLGLRVQQANE